MPSFIVCISLFHSEYVRMWDSCGLTDNRHIASEAGLEVSRSGQAADRMLTDPEMTMLLQVQQDQIAALKATLAARYQKRGMCCPALVYNNFICCVFLVAFDSCFRIFTCSPLCVSFIQMKLMRKFSTFAPS